jgi:hypothetical protein
LQLPTDKVQGLLPAGWHQVVRKSHDIHRLTF